MRTKLRNRVPIGVPTAGQYSNETKLESANLHLVRNPGYRHGVWSAPSNDGNSNPITAMTDSFGDDVLDHPELYGLSEGDSETMEQLRRVCADPDIPVTIYRAAPPEIGEINPGDWVTLSSSHAKQYAAQGDESEDWPIIEQRVPAEQVFSDGESLARFGYDGPVLGSSGNGPITLAEMRARKHPSAAHR